MRQRYAACQIYFLFKQESSLFVAADDYGFKYGASSNLPEEKRNSIILVQGVVSRLQPRGTF